MMKQHRRGLGVVCGIGLAAGLAIACGGRDDSSHERASAGVETELQTSGKGLGQGQDNVSLCHIPPGNPSNVHVITVGAPAVPAHQAHGDGICASGAQDCCLESGPTSLCTNLQTDTGNCGACGTVCPGVANGFPTCAGGVCGISCNSAFTACPANAPTACVDTSSDTNNCGSCGHVCPAAARRYCA